MGTPRGLLVATVLLVACGSEVTFLAPDGATSGESAGAGGTGATPATGGTASSGASTASAGGQGDAGGPTCAVPDCPSSESVINCDPACGVVHPGCASCTLADDASIITLPYGSTELRMPPIAAPRSECVQCGDPSAPWWDMRLALPVGAHCFDIDLPDAVAGTLFTVESGAAIPALCGEGSPTDIPRQCASICVEDTLPTTTLWVVLRVEDGNLGSVPDGGANVDIVVLPDASSSCQGGCNGEGATPAP